MALDFGEYIRNYLRSGDGDGTDDGDDEVSPLLKLNVDCLYYDIDDMAKLVIPRHNHKYTAIHLNIHSLPSKYDQLRHIIAHLEDIGLVIHFIMLCETFLSHINMNMFPLPGYQFVCNNRKQGRVGLYIRDEFQFSIRSDLSVSYDREFESIFTEINHNGHKLVLGEIYRVPGTNEQMSIQRYDSILQNLSDFNGDVIIGTDQNFNYLDIEKHSKTRDLLDIFISSGFLPTVTLPTRITHNTSILIDNIYIKCKRYDKLVSGIMSVDISDHLPLFTFVGQNNHTKSPPKKVTYRPVDDIKLNNIQNYLNAIDWDIMQTMTTDQSYDYFNGVLLHAMDTYIPEKTITIPYKNVLKQPWMTSALLKSSKTKDKMYRKCIGKQKDSLSFKNYIRYRNKFNELKRICKQNYFADELTLYQNDLKKTWKILKSLIGKTNNKSGISDMFNINNTMIKKPKTIADKFCDYFTEIGHTYASNILPPNRPFQHYLQHANSNSFFMMPTDPIEISRIITSLKPKTSSGHDSIS